MGDVGRPARMEHNSGCECPRCMRDAFRYVLGRAEAEGHYQEFTRLVTRLYGVPDMVMGDPADALERERCRARARGDIAYPVAPEAAVKAAKTALAGTEGAVTAGTLAAGSAERRVPDPADYARAADERERKISAARLDALDREHPSYAVSLPAGWDAPWHADWRDARRAYVLGDDSALSRMLDYVTPDSPPLAGEVAADVISNVHRRHGVFPWPALAGVALVFALWAYLVMVMLHGVRY